MSSETTGLEEANRKVFDKFLKKQVRKEMKAAIKLASVFSDLMQGEHSIRQGGWLDFYAYATLDDAKEMLRPIVTALKPLMMKEAIWNWNLFGNDGSLTTMADGSGDSDYECVDLFA